MIPPKPDTSILAELRALLAELRALRADLASPPAVELHAPDVAALLGCNERWVLDSTFDVTRPWERCERWHVLPGRKIGKRWVYHRDLIDQFVRGEYVRPDAPPAPAAMKRRSA